MTETDKDIITFGNKLSDRHINFAQSLIKNFKQLSGLYSTLSVSQMSTPVLSGKISQILHTGGDHWVLASNINCGIGQVNLYNSLYTVVSSETQILIEKVFGNATIMLPSRVCAGRFTCTSTYSNMIIEYH